MEPSPNDLAHELMLDGNAVAGLLGELFTAEMTAAPSECVSCGNVAAIGTLHAYTRGPGSILRCSICGSVVLRVVRTPEAAYLDARGAVYVRIAMPAR